MRLGGSLFQASLGQKVCEIPISIEKSWVWWFAPVIPATAENHKIGLQLRLAWTEKQDPILKITRAKRAGGVAQVVEYLPTKCESLISKPSTANSNNNK
jgi:hypothetical protein